MLSDLRGNDKTTGVRAKRSGYHHGDLRRALLLQALAAGSLEAVSLRQLAAGIGVSAAAVYRHFSSKDQLLLALAGIGFDRLNDAFAAAFQIGEAPRDAAAARQRLARLGQAYLDFAAAEPALWRLMFGPLAAPYRAQGPPGGRVSTFDYLPAALLGLHRTGVLPVAPTPSDVLFAWSAIHGLAALRDGRVPLAGRETGPLAAEITGRIVAALAANRSG